MVEIYVFGPPLKQSRLLKQRQEAVAMADGFLESPLNYSSLDETFRISEERYKKQGFGIVCNGSDDIDSDVLDKYFDEYPPGWYEYYLGDSVLICPHDVVLISSELGVEYINELIGKLRSAEVRKGVVQ